MRFNSQVTSTAVVKEGMRAYQALQPASCVSAVSRTASIDEPDAADDREAAHGADSAAQAAAVMTCAAAR